MKIIHITASYKPAYIYGGPIQSVGKLCEATISDTHQQHIDLEVFTTTANGKNELPVETKKPLMIDGVRVTYFERWTKDHSHFSPDLLLGLQKALKQAQQKNEQIIIHIHAWWNLVSVLSCLIAKWYNIPVVLSPRGMLTNYSQNNRHASIKSLFHRLIGKHLLEYCHIHATSTQEKENIQSIIQPKTITIIHNLVNIPSDLSNSDESNMNKENLGLIDKFKIIFLSRIEEKKGLPLLFNALAKIQMPFTLTIAGTGLDEYIASLKKQAIILKIDDQIQWVGQVSNNEKFKLLAQHDLLVLTSYNENFANVIIESLSVGTSVLISDQVGLSSYVKTKQLGWITTLNPNDILKTISEAILDAEKLNLIRKQAPIMIANDFKDAVLVQQYLYLYKDTAN
ncbi:XrtY-associated glycosyltransferase XYAG1 [Pedobacter sp. R20-19]|uniref:XrtY-associated glycosyltransferase XYAG1 n=1 Tax=Pedobacter sp. R20-19 TaxID=1270196 RepID=UPI00049378E0|nr:glycosyltransferase [Pedobacter sp. R20-19]